MSTHKQPDPSSHYTGAAGRQYHDERSAWRSEAGQLTRTRYFSGFSTNSDVVLDFGCGVGRILANIPAKKRIGIEINEAASVEAATLLDEVHKDLDCVVDESVDAIISFHALEHCSNPHLILTKLRTKLRTDGRLRVVVPMDSVFLQPGHRYWKNGDRDMHLFAWTPMTLGNLMHFSGFKSIVARVEPFSDGGKLAKALCWAPRLESGARWFKSLRNRRLQVIATAQAG